MRLLLNCDQVFDVLTRGPFPTGEPGDEAVEHHLRACHDCRQLAEALRPAVALMHEAVTVEQAMALPEYSGSLPETQPLKGGRRGKSPDAPQLQPRSLRQGLRLLTPPSQKSSVARRQDRRFADAVRLIAAAVLVAALGLLLHGVAISPGPGNQRTIARGRPEPAGQFSVPRPDSQGLITLVSLQLPTTCFPASHVPGSENEATRLVAAMAEGSLANLHCCTECHHAGGRHSTSAHGVAVAQRNCHLCHRS